MKLIYCKFLILVLFLLSCGEKTESKDNQGKEGNEEKSIISYNKTPPINIKTPDGMVWVSGIRFTQGAQRGDKYALPREFPAHPVAVDGFFIDITEVTNAEFSKFVKETGYVTIAEQPIDWEEMKKQLPAGTPKPHDSILQPGSLIFNRTVENVSNLNDYSQWWKWKVGANWRHPAGPGSSLEGKENFPVVHIAYEDALAYCKWANRRLPTETEWEAAAHGKLPGGIYTWEGKRNLSEKANTWEGNFPVYNSETDGYKYAAPVKSFPPNSLGIYQMLGNVWEITSDWFNVNYYHQALSKGEIHNPKGASQHYNPDNPYEKEKVIKGGSFLCNASYCASYRISARMGQALGSASDHTGFRTVATVTMLQNTDNDIHE